MTAWDWFGVYMLAAAMVTFASILTIPGPFRREHDYVAALVIAFMGGWLLWPIFVWSMLEDWFPTKTWPMWRFRCAGHRWVDSFPVSACPHCRTVTTGRKLKHPL